MKYIAPINLILACLIFVLVGNLVLTSKKIEGLQQESREMLVQIQQNSQVRQVTGNVATNIVKDMAQLSLNNANLLQLLNKHGFNVQVRGNQNSSN